MSLSRRYSNALQIPRGATSSFSWQPSSSCASWGLPSSCELPFSFLATLRVLLTSLLRRSAVSVPSWGRYSTDKMRRMTKPTRLVAAIMVRHATIKQVHFSLSRGKFFSTRARACARAQCVHFARCSIQFRARSNKLFVTTDTLLRAMAAAAATPGNRDRSMAPTRPRQSESTPRCRERPTPGSA